MRKDNKKNIDILKANAAKITYVLTSAAVLIIFTVALFFTTNIIQVNDGESNQIILSTFSDEDKILKLANVELDESDKVIYTSYDGNYKNITIRRTFTVPITVDGNTIEGKINQGTVEDCLINAGVVLGEHDFTSPSLHHQLNPGDSIRVYRVEYMDQQYEEAIPFETKYKTSSLTYRFPKRRYTLEEGQNGTNLVTYRERYVDGELSLSLVSKIETIKQPVDKVVLSYGKGVPISPLSGPAGVTVSNGVPSGYTRVIENVSATGYHSKRGKGSSGLGLYCGTVAVNPNVIPYGTKMYIASPDGKFVYGWAIATDTGGALMENPSHIDLFYDSDLESSLNWRNNVNIYIY